MASNAYKSSIIIDYTSNYRYAYDTAIKDINLIE